MRSLRDRRLSAQGRLGSGHGNGGTRSTCPRHYAGPSGRTRKEAMASLAARGFTRIDGSSCRVAAARVSCCPAGPAGPAFLVTRNFDAIYSYNAPNLCAASRFCPTAARTARACRGHGRRRPWPVTRPTGARCRRFSWGGGYDLDGKRRDGVIGAKTTKAISDFQSRSGLLRTAAPAPPCSPGYAESEAALFRRMKALAWFIHDLRRTP